MTLTKRILPRAGSPWILALVLLPIGLYLLVGGAELLMLGGSAYYVLTGLAVTAVAVLLWRGRKLGMWLYAAMLGWTLVWALWEVGFDGWGLAPRLIAPFVLGLWFLLPHVRRGLA
jgi:quinoprotein glucose dehydrogenase